MVTCYESRLSKLPSNVTLFELNSEVMIGSDLESITLKAVAMHIPLG